MTGRTGILFTSPEKPRGINTILDSLIWLLDIFRENKVRKRQLDINCHRNKKRTICCRNQSDFELSGKLPSSSMVVL